ncbi:MAG: class I adenylate-forming enzyme family protein [Myxococcota bacterium]
MADSSWLLERIESFGDQTALHWRHRTLSYRELRAEIEKSLMMLRKHAVKPGDVVGMRGDYSPATCAFLLALIANQNIVVPLAPTVKTLDEFLSIAEVKVLFHFADSKLVSIEHRAAETSHPLIGELQQRGAPGLILFSSGSTGKSKASLLDFDKFLKKFQRQRPGARTLTFLLLDHIGGINTLMHVLTSGGTIVPVDERTPAAVCKAIEQHRIQLLPTTPTFLNMLLISEVYRSHDLSSLELITYGTEPMPSSTLRHLHEVFPKVQLKQTYGLSELGILQTKSKDSESLWVKVGGDGYQLKVVDGVLWVKAESAMLGYLNAPSPFDQDGWFNTGDAVEVDGEYMKILGRKSELINVGGEKVYPAEVESVLLQLPNVRDVTVVGRPNPITGQVVVARITLQEPEELSAVVRRMRSFCSGRLAPYKVPVAVDLVEGQLHGDRFKKARSSTSTLA